VNSERPHRRRTLQRILAIRVLAVSLSACVALTTFFAFRYMLDTPRLRRLTLENEVRLISDALAHGEDPTLWPEFAKYPQNYAFRVYNHRTSDRRKLIMEVNASLLPSLAHPDAENPEYALSEGFGPAQTPGGEAIDDRWQVIDHFDVKGFSYWVQMVMVGDPAWRWRRVVEEEVRDHVMVPVLFIIPALGVAMLLTTMAALRPLRHIAARAESLGRAVERGGPLAPLPEEDLPLEIRNVVAAINAMLQQLERSLLLQKQFASDVAHELRTPLAIVVLEAARLPESPVREAITSELSALSTLVNQLLRFAQAEDVMTRERAQVDLSGVVRKVCEDLASTAVRRGVVIEFDAPDLPVQVLGNAALIDIAIRNVLDNAIRFAPVDSNVSVTVARDATVYVEDCGPGVPDKQKELIFDRFWRADRSRGGAGIGLALVRRVARLHGGDVLVEDRVGGGARFILSFATQKVHSAQSRSTQALAGEIPLA
jgi:signal transduction histidine kinase